jgi:hypothetical protein
MAKKKRVAKVSKPPRKAVKKAAKQKVATRTARVPRTEKLRGLDPAI